MFGQPDANGLGKPHAPPQTLDRFFQLRKEGLSENI